MSTSPSLAALVPTFGAAVRPVQQLFHRADSHSAAPGRRAPEESEWLWINLHISPLLRLARSLFINAPLIVFAFLFSVPTLLAAVNVDPKKVVESPAFSWLLKDLENVNSNISQLLSTWVPSLVIVVANNIMFSLLDLASKCFSRP
jgi:hypothetical protein